MDLETIQGAKREDILVVARRHGATSIRVFGSTAHGDAAPNSDLDLLVEWEPSRSLLDHIGLAQDLEELLGVKVHIRTENSIHRHTRERVLSEAISI